MLQDRDGRPDDSPAYFSWADEQGKVRALAQAGQAYRRLEPLVRSSASNLYYNVGPHNTSVRDGFDRHDYQYFRPGERLPCKPKEWINACMKAYDDHAILKNVIDLMSDFTVQGIDLCHPNERIERFYKDWFRRVQGEDRSERFANLLYRGGQVVARRHTARVGKRDEERMRRSQAAPDEAFPREPDVYKREIPVRYTFYDPRVVELLNEDVAPFLGRQHFRFGVRIPARVTRQANSQSDHDRAFLLDLPDDVREAVRTGAKVIPLDPDKTVVYYYKRDDWEPWARPMASPLLKQFIMLEKLQLADMAALDGVISSIRVWKLGSLAEKIMPSEATMLRLAEMLANNVGGGVMDMVWGPDIDLLETSTVAHQFLGDTKYGPTLKAIFQGLGVPATLTGEANPGGFTNNYVSLKTLVERLEYGRSVLREFWAHEIRLVQRAMGFRFPATLTFDQLLTDEAAEKQLLLHMADRDLISTESLQERFGLTPEIEEVRARREMRRRKDGLAPAKASPFHDANHKGGLEKIYAQTGQYAPEELGVELKPKNPGSVPPAESASRQKQAERPKGQPGQGRPPLKKDSTKRKRKVVKPRTSAFLNVLAEAERLQADIAHLTTPLYLKAVDKQNMRQLTDQEAAAFEEYKFALLCRAKLEQEVTEGWVAGQQELSVPPAPAALFDRAVSAHTKRTGKPPTAEVRRRYQASAYALGVTNEEEDGED